jgi:hypothetical protein
MEKKNVYVRAREIVRELAPLVHRIREQDAKLADQLRRAAALAARKPPRHRADLVERVVDPRD